MGNEKKEKKDLSELTDYENARNAINEENMAFMEEEYAPVYGSASDRFFATIQNYFMSCKEMMISSASHLTQPVTLIVILLLVITYLLLGVAGSIEFSFFSNNIVQYVQTNLDIIVNALLGFFYGPVTCAISVAICTIMRMITNKSVFFIGYIIGAFVAGAMHGWILYRFKARWFGTRFNGFFTGLFAKSVITRICVSVFVNILLMSALYKIFIHYPFRDFIIHYSKSGVPLSSPAEFFRVFFVSAFFESIIIFVAIVVVNYIVAKAFPNVAINPDAVVKIGGKDEAGVIADDAAEDENK